MMAAHWVTSLVAVATALLAAVLAVLGGHWLQHRVGRRIRDADDLKARLYDFLALVTEYWMGETRDSVLEAKVLATKSIVIADIRQMQYHSARLRRWFLDTRGCRLDMIDAATGGCFQQSDWASDPNRVTKVAREMGRIMRTLRRVC